ncbi:MAG: ABC transporter ATP-binding protein [Clostridia bacterium]|nr:ABC transporter ATP-binding protein [Clostridia bacterium]
MSIKINNLHKNFDGQELFGGIDVSFAKGCITCITGKSGLGKTTLLRILMGLETPDSGSVTGLDGMRVSAVFQEDRLCEALSASANASIALPKGSSRSLSDDILRALGLSQDLLKPVSEMSGGMRRRVSIARALAARYDLLLLDEPFTGLDKESRNLAIRCIRRYAEGKTILLITHDSEVPTLIGGTILNLEKLSSSKL